MATHFTKEERFYIEKRLVIGESPKEIAKSLGRHKSNILLHDIKMKPLYYQCFS